MDLALTWHMWATLALIAGGVILYSLDKFSIESVSVGILVVLLVFFHIFPARTPEGAPILTPNELLAGFANPALFAILGLLVIGQGMFQSGALEGPTQQILSVHEKHPIATRILVFCFVLVISALMNNTPVVVMFIPIMAALAMEAKLPTSRLMIPLSFMCILGGMTTLIGSSTNLLVANVLTQTTGDRIGFFDITPLGLMLAVFGVAYLFLVAPRLLPDRQDMSEEITTTSEGKQFIAQLEVTPNHPLVGARSVAGLFPDLPDVTVRMIQRRQGVVLPPYDDVTLAVGDILIVAATRATLTKLLKSKPEFLEDMLSVGPAPEEGAPQPSTKEITMVEAIVAPGSRLIGRAVDHFGFHYQTNCVLLGVQRRSRMIRAQLNAIRLEAGDVLLVLGARRDIRSLRADRDILLLEWSMTDVPDMKNAMRAQLIFAGVILAAATGVVPIVIAALAGAGAMILTGCLNIRQASRAIDRRIFLLVGVALAMGAAMQATGGASFLATQLVGALGPFGPSVVLSAFFLMTAALTNVLSNNATAVLFTPVAISAAEQTGVDPMAFVFTVIFAANCSFATPIAYQTNLLVMGPGHYKFRDFIVVGVPLIIVLWAAYTVLAPFYFRWAGMM
ncbi:MAG: SLC13 family permease [Pseudomonadota bacterium]